MQTRVEGILIREPPLDLSKEKNSFELLDEFVLSKLVNRLLSVYLNLSYQKVRRNVTAISKKRQRG